MATNFVFRLSAISAKKNSLLAFRGASIARHLQRTLSAPTCIKPGPLRIHEVQSNYLRPVSMTEKFGGKNFHNSFHQRKTSLNVTNNSNGSPSLLHTSTVNRQELFVLPKNSSSGSKHWFTERVVAIGLLGLVPVGIMYPVQLVDYSLALLLPLHSYWGINAILSDYFWRPGLPLAKATWLLLSLLSAAGLMYINVNDVGICQLIAMFLKI